MTAPNASTPLPLIDEPIPRKWRAVLIDSDNDPPDGFGHINVRNVDGSISSLHIQPLKTRHIKAIIAALPDSERAEVVGPDAEQPAHGPFLLNRVREILSGMEPNLKRVQWADIPAEVRRIKELAMGNGSWELLDRAQKAELEVELLRAKLAAATEIIESTQRDRDGLRTIANKCEADYQAMQRELTAERCRADRLSAEKQGLHVLLDAAVEEREGWEGKATATQRELDECRRERDEAREGCKRLQNDGLYLSHELRDYRSLAEKLARQRRELRRLNAAILTAKTWAQVRDQDAQRAYAELSTALQKLTAAESARAELAATVEEQARRIATMEECYALFKSEHHQVVDSANYPRPVVRWFARQMEDKLRANDHKGDWSDCSLEYLMKRLEEEVAELKLLPNDIDEAADVANFALMIADRAMQRTEKEATP